MSLTGVIDFGSLLTFSLPGGAFSMIGSDGNHYAIGCTSGVMNVGCAETESVIYTRTEAQWRVDLTSLGLGTSGTYSREMVVPGKDSPYFWILGHKPDTPNSWCVGVRYKINSTASVTVDGGLHLGAGDPLISGESGVFNGECYGATVVGSTLYVYTDVGYPSVVPHLARYVVALPLTGNLVDTAANAVQSISTIVGAEGSTHAFSWSSPLTSGERQLTDKVGVMALPSGNLGLFRYIGKNATVALYYCEINPATRVVVVTPTDVSAAFGVPFADVGFDYDGSSSPYGESDYTAPSIGAEGEVVFARGFDDDKSIARVRRYLFTAVDDVTFLGQYDFEHNNEVFTTQIEMAQAYREGDELLVMFSDGFRFIFGFTTIVFTPPEDCPDQSYRTTFSVLSNTDFLDWAEEAAAPSSCQVVRNPANFISYLWTFYHLQDDTMFWMYSPYTMTYLRNNARGSGGIGCFFQPVWEWSDSSSTSKFAEQLQIYRAKLPDQDVIDVKNRVRGKGRALQFRYTSETGKDFHLLGWGVTTEKNTKP